MPAPSRNASKRKRTDDDDEGPPRRRGRETPSESEPYNSDNTRDSTTAGNDHANTDDMNDDDNNDNNIDLAEETNPSHQQPLHQQVEDGVDNNNDTNNSEDDSNNNSTRTERLQGLLRHRKILIDRLRLARTAAQRRIQTLPETMHKTSHQQEVEAFRELCRQVNALARKATKIETNDTTTSSTATTSTILIDKKTSLRKGSTVGKRMNAALSSLTGTEESKKINTPKPTTTTPKPINAQTTTTTIARTKPPTTTAIPPSPMRTTGEITTRRQPQVICQQTIELRQRRENIQHKIARLVRGTHTTATATNTLRQPPLPHRRVTHWDYLLQEMQWMATDFIQERKWKIAAASTISQTILHRHDVVPVNTVVEKVTKQPEVELPTMVGYVPVTESDRIQAKKVAAVVAFLVDELHTVVESVGAFAPSNEPYAKALDRFLDKRKGILEGQVGQETVKQSDTLEQKEETTKEMDVEQTPVQTANDDDTERERMISRISEHFDSVVKLAQTTLKISSSALTIGKIQLTMPQTIAFETVSDRWTKSKIGTVLSGPLASGKTIIACALLSKHGSQGPQLVITNTATMIRWVHELCRHKNLRVRSIGGSRGILSPSTDDTSDSNFVSNDVVVIDHSTLFSIPNDVLVRFVSIILDARFPSGFYGSRNLVCGEDEDSFDTGRNALIVPQLRSPEWWKVLAETAIRSGANRLIIECMTSKDVTRILLGLSERQRLSIMALRMSFLIGMEDILSYKYSLQKKILAWARQRIKSAHYKGAKFERIKLLFIDIVGAFYFRVESKSLDELIQQWEVRKCEMTPPQRNLYKLKCAETRAILSSPLRLFDPQLKLKRNPFVAIADALMCLRRQCVHGDAVNLIFNPKYTSYFSFPSNSDEECTSLPKLDSPSQPNLELAHKILESSCKLTELMLLLRDEGVLAMNTLRILETIPFFKSNGHGKITPGKVMAKRIAIVAVLPEVLLLISILFNAVGVRHAVFLKHCPNGNECMSDDAMHQWGLWSQCQLKLSQFNQDESESTNIIVTSPVTVSGDVGGLGLEAADLIVSIDEDWSGRGEMLMKSLLARCTSRKRSQQSETPKFVKLVVRKTCEEVFVSHLEKAFASDQSQTPWPWPLSYIGAFTSYGSSKSNAEIDEIKHAWNAKMASVDSFGFPGKNLFELCDEDLTVVLATSLLPPLFASSSGLKFLPLLDMENRYEVESYLIEKLLSREELASPYSEILTQKSSEEFSKYVSILPPPDRDIKLDFVARKDTLCISTRLFIDQNVSKQTRVPTSIVDGTLASLTHGAGGTLASSAQMDESCSDAEKDYWQGMISSKPTADLLSSLLFDSKRHISRDEVQGQNLLESETPRVNFFCRFFSSGRSFTKDGCYSEEATIYLPPVFPRLRESARSASIQISGLQKNRKYQVLNSPADVNAEFNGDKDKNEPSRSLHLQPTVITEDEASHNDAASVLLDVSDDFGLAGIGAVPLPQDSAVYAAGRIVSTRRLATGAYSNGNEWFSSLNLCDHEELQAFDRKTTPDTNDPIILFVSRKRARGFVGPAGTAPAQRAQQELGSPVPVPITGTNGVVYDVNRSGKNAKGATSAFSRLSANDMPSSTLPPALPQGQMQLTKTKDLQKARLLASVRQPGLVNSLYEAPTFRVASLRLRDRITQKLAEFCWQGHSYDVGPGLPIFVSKQHASGYRSIHEMRPGIWTSIVKRMKNRQSLTGDEALEISNAQLAAFRRHPTNPRRVDFGPFQIGFLSSPNGMAIVGSHRSRTGVSLPMGVKIFQTVKESSMHWNAFEDEMLEKAVARFGTNWNLVARFVSGFQELTLFGDLSRLGYPSVRAPRSCRDRWQVLVRAKPTMAKDVRQAEKAYKVAAILPYNKILEITASDDISRVSTTRSGGDDVDILFPPRRDIINNPIDSEKEGDTNGQHNSVTKIAGKFDALKGAQSKKVVVPLNMPGIAKGNPPQVVPSHPSHMQSVQSSIVASWTGGRSDMWPLQVLEAADRQRATTAAATVSASRTSVPSSSTNRPSSLASGAQHVSSNKDSYPVPTAPIQSRSSPRSSHPSIQTVQATLDSPKQNTSSPVKSADGHDAAK